MTRNAFAALLLGLALLGGVLLFVMERWGPLPGIVNTSSSFGTIRADLDRLERRVAALEAARANPAVAPVPGDERVSVDHSDGELRARIESLEAKLASAATSPTSSSPTTPPDTEEAILRAIKDLDSTPDGVNEALHRRAQQRIELRKRLLELFPDTPDAANQLEGLVSDQLEVDRAGALESLDRFGPRVKVQPWVLDDWRANALVYNQHFEEGRAAYQRVVRTSPDEYQRATAHFFFAYSYVNEGRHADARRAFEDLLAQYASDPSPSLKNILDGARAQLAQLDELEKKK